MSYVLQVGPFRDQVHPCPSHPLSTPGDQKFLAITLRSCRYVPGAFEWKTSLSPPLAQRLSHRQALPGLGLWERRLNLERAPAAPPPGPPPAGPCPAGVPGRGALFGNEPPPPAPPSKCSQDKRTVLPAMRSASSGTQGGKTLMSTKYASLLRTCCHNHPPSDKYPGGFLFVRLMLFHTIISPSL